ALEVLKAAIVAAGGSIGTVRVSSAQSSTKYSYWGAVRYELRLTAKGAVTHTATERASSDRRSVAGAKRDARALVAREGRLYLGTELGRISEASARGIIRDLGVGAVCERANDYSTSNRCHQAQRQPQRDYRVQQAELRQLATTLEEIRPKL